MSIRYYHLKVVGGRSFKIVCGASNRNFLKSASEMALVNALVSVRSSTVSSLKFMGKLRILLLFFNWRFVEKGNIFVLLPGIDWSCNMISVSRTGF